MENESLPIDLVILDCSPRSLGEFELTKVIYADWFCIVEPRVGVVLAVSESEVGPLNIQLMDLEDGGFSFKNCKIERVPNNEKKWNDADGFYTTLSRKFSN